MIKATREQMEAMSKEALTRYLELRAIDKKLEAAEKKLSPKQTDKRMLFSRFHRVKSNIKPDLDAPYIGGNNGIHPGARQGKP